MGTHAKVKISRLESQLQERMDKLLIAIRGSESNSSEETDYEPLKKMYVDASSVRVAVDDFQTILKEIKRELK